MSSSSIEATTRLYRSTGVPRLSDTWWRRLEASVESKLTTHDQRFITCTAQRVIDQPRNQPDLVLESRMLVALLLHSSSTSVAF